MDKSGLYRVINNLRNTITLEHCVIRFIMAWCFVSLVESFIMNSRRYMINSLSKMLIWFQLLYARWY